MLRSGAILHEEARHKARALRVAAYGFFASAGIMCVAYFLSSLVW